VCVCVCLGWMKLKTSDVVPRLILIMDTSLWMTDHPKGMVA